jgi:hypothetical protein
VLVERAYEAFWIAQGIAVLAILLRDAWRRDWVKATGAIVGFAVGFLPFAGIFIHSSMFSANFFGFLIFAVPVALAVACGLRRRWAFFILALAFSVGPYAFTTLANLLSPMSSAAKGEPLLTFFEIYFHFEPILAVLTGRELSAWVGTWFAKECTA